MKQHLTHPRIAAGGRLSVRDLSADQMAEAVVRAAIITGETSLLAYRYEAALKGQVAFRARWLALAALLALHQDEEVQRISEPLGCGFAPLRVLAGVRGRSSWDEACVSRLFLDLAGDDEAVPLGEMAGLKAQVAEEMQRRIDRWAAGRGHPPERKEDR